MTTGPFGRGAPPGKPIIIDGTIYPTMTAGARAVGVSKPRITQLGRQAVKRGETRNGVPVLWTAPYRKMQKSHPLQFDALAALNPISPAESRDYDRDIAAAVARIEARKGRKARAKVRS